MEIKDIKNRWVKIGNTSITVKNDDTGKTVGIVKNITRFTDMQPNKQINYSKLLRDSGVWGRGEAKNAIVDSDGKIYYIFNTNGLDIQKKCFPEEYENKIDFINKVEKYMEVIPVRF